MGNSSDLARQLNAASVRMVRALRREKVRPTLAHEHRSALSLVVLDGPLRIGALARAERVTAQAMTKTVGILERAGLVARVEDPSDARAVIIRATPAGELVVREGVDERVERIVRALESLPPADRARVVESIASLESLVAAIEREPVE
jgi:DNA-binding MarR family transcriptional regulator